MKSFTLIHGRLGKDPELKPNAYTDKKGNPQPLVNLSVGVGRDVGDETDWYNATAFGPRAAVIDKWFKKGDEILLWGRMESNVNENKKYWKLNVEGFDFCGKASGGDSKQSSPVNNAFPEPLPDSWEQAEEDCPF